MNAILSVLRSALFCLLLAINIQLQLFAQGTAFTYQGLLEDGGNPASGTYDLRFGLYDAASAGTQQGGLLTNSATAVSNGLLTVTLDFGNQFPGANRWLEIAARTNGGGAFSTLIPRQQLTPTPYAITASNLTGNLPASQLGGTIGNDQLANNALSVNAGSGLSGGGTVALGGSTSLGISPGGIANAMLVNPSLTVAAGTGLTGGGLVALGDTTTLSLSSNVNAATLNGLASSNFWQTGGNSGATPTTGNFLGTTDNQPLELKVNNQRAFRLEPNATTAAPNIVGGSSINFVAPGKFGAFIGGGGATNYNGVAYTNSISENFGVIGGGIENTLYASESMIGGGAFNTIQTGAYLSMIGGGQGNTIQTNSNYSTIGGGQGNAIQTYVGYSMIGGGQGNTIQTSAYFSMIGGGAYNTIQTNSTYSMIGGGYVNTSTGQYAAVPGGDQNVAAQSAFAAGHRAKANHTGSFVWADSTDADFADTGADQFLVRASGGVGIGATNLTGALYIRQPTGAPSGAMNSQDNGLGIGCADVNSYKWLQSYGGALALNPLGNNVGIGTSSPGHLLQVGNAGSPAYCDGTTWVNGSDRYTKQDFAEINARQVLQKVSALQISEWRYKSEANGMRHLGPMAQDFHTAFGLNGNDDKHISTVDEGGVALAAIQGLNQKVESENAELLAQNAALKQENDSLAQRLNALEETVKTLADRN